MAWTTDDLVAAVKRKCQAPSAGWQFTDPEILDIAWEETIKRLVPPVRTVREDFWTTTTDYSLAGLPTFVRIPMRAAASTTTSFWVLVAGDPKPKPLTRLPAADRQRFEGMNAGVPGYYALEGDRVYLYRPPGQSGLTLRVQYDRRPSRYVSVAECAVVDGLDPPNTRILTTGVTRAPGTYSIDVIAGGPPCDVLVSDVSGVWSDAAPTYPGQAWYAVDAATFDVLSAMGQISAYVTLAGYTCVPPLPDVLHPALVDFTAVQCLSDTGKVGKADSIRADIETYLPDVVQTLAVRVSDDPEIAFNAESPLRAGCWR